MPISPAILEEFLEDTKRLTQQIVQYGDRWSRYGEQLEKRMSESQRAELKDAMDVFLGELTQLGVDLAKGGAT